MTKKRIKKLAEKWWRNDDMGILDFISIVTAEAHNEAIDEMRDVMLKVFAAYEDEEEIIREEAARLKERG